MAGERCLPESAPNWDMCASLHMSTLQPILLIVQRVSVGCGVSSYAGPRALGPAAQPPPPFFSKGWGTNGTKCLSSRLLSPTWKL